MEKRIENQLQSVPDVAMATNTKIRIILFLSLLLYLSISIIYCKSIIHFIKVNDQN